MSRLSREAGGCRRANSLVIRCRYSRFLRQNLGYDFGQNQLSHTDTELFGRHEVRMESQNLHIGGSVRF